MSSGPGNTSEYTRFNLDRCTVTSRATEGEYVEYSCSGRGDAGLFAALGDGRMDLDAGVRNERFEGLSAFNDIGAQIEWRLHGGVPVAIIFRYRDATPEGRAAGRSVLAVEKVGRPGAPGCRVAQLAGSTAQVNQRAREIADRTAPGFPCGRGQVTYIGNSR